MGTGGPFLPDPPGMDGLSTVELVGRARDGDRQAIDQLFARYLPLLRSWAAGRLPRWARDMVDTDDMIQDTLMRTFRNVGSFEPRHDGALGAYLRQALNNRIRDEIRKVEAGTWPRDDNPLKGAPHTAAALLGADWTHAYSREEAAFPRASLRRAKYWSPVGRVDNVWGDRNLSCSCPPLASYED